MVNKGGFRLTRVLKLNIYNYLVRRNEMISSYYFLVKQFIHKGDYHAYFC